jgi:hypothetical protein
MDQARERLAARFRRQAGTAIQRGSPLYVELLERTADDVERGGAAWRLLAGRAGEPRGSALPLRLMAAAHRLVLAGEAPELAPYYPSAGGTRPPADSWPAFERLLEQRAGELDALVDRPLQTNEVGRCAALVLGFATVARETGLPLSLLEVGASAGLNLNWHRYRYGDAGPRDSPVRLEAPPGLDALPAVAAARGCDAEPLDIRDPDARLTLRSCVWADQLERLALLDAALEVAEAWPPAIERADGVQWLEERLAGRSPSTATVVFHSIVLQYLPPRRRARLGTAIAEAGGEATRDAPLAWLRLEPPPRRAMVARLAELRLVTWPGGADRLLAQAGYHGSPVIATDPGAPSR